MPISGILHENSTKLNFKIISFPIFYSAFIQIGILMLCVTSVITQLTHKIEYTKVGRLGEFWAPRKVAI